MEFAIIGAAAGFLAGYLGIGGGIAVVPGLIWLFSREPETAGMAAQLAVATSLASMLVTSLSSIVAHHRRGAIAWPVVRMIAGGLAAGAIGGAYVATILSAPALATAFGLFALLAGAQMIHARPPAAQRPLPGPGVTTATGVVMGGISSLVGIGGGSMTAPWLMWHGREPRQAVATAAACGYPIALAGTATFLVLGGGSGERSYVHWPAFAGIALFSMMFAPLGAAAVHRSPPRLVRRIFGGFLILVGLRFVLT